MLPLIWDYAQDILSVLSAFLMPSAVDRLVRKHKSPNAFEWGLGVIIFAPTLVSKAAGRWEDWEIYPWAVMSVVSLAVVLWRQFAPPFERQPKQTAAKLMYAALAKGDRCLVHAQPAPAGMAGCGIKIKVWPSNKILPRTRLLAFTPGYCVHCCVIDTVLVWSKPLPQADHDRLTKWLHAYNNTVQAGHLPALTLQPGSRLRGEVRILSGKLPGNVLCKEHTPTV